MVPIPAEKLAAVKVFFAMAVAFDFRLAQASRSLRPYQGWGQPMVRNSPRPRELAQKVIKSVKDSVSASLDTCVAFAEAWTLYGEGGWTDKDLISFLTQLHAARIGPDPELLSRDKEDRILIGTSSASFYTMKRIGESELLKDKEIRAVCLINSRSSLYDLIQFYEEACERGGGSAAKKEERAREKVLTLLTTHGEGLTRKLIAEARKQLGKQRQSHKPKELPEASLVGEGGTTLADLLESGETFHEVLLTPSAEVLDQIEEMTFSDLEEALGFQPLLKAKAVVNVVVPGDRVGAIAKLQEVLRIDSPKLYCLRAHNDKKYVLDLSQETLLFSNHTLDGDAKPKDGEDIAAFLQRAMGSDANATRLHLFAKQETAGWVSCVGENASWIQS